MAIERASDVHMLVACLDRYILFDALLVLFMILVVLFVTLTFEPNPVKPGRLSNSSSISLAIES